MALYIPASRRRRRVVVVGIAALVLGLLVGALVGRSTAPTTTDTVNSVQSAARRTAAGLRVIALHDESGAASTQVKGDAGIALVLSRTRKELNDEFNRAVWLAPKTRADVLGDLDALEASTDRKSAEFARQTEALAARIESTFGGSN